MELQDWRDRFSELYETHGISPQELPEELRAEYADFCKVYKLLSEVEFTEPEIPRNFRGGILARISAESRERAKPQRASLWNLLPKYSARLALAGAAAVLMVFVLLNPAARQTIARAFVGEGSVERIEPSAPAWAKRPMGPLTVNIRYDVGLKSATVELSAESGVVVDYGLGPAGASQSGTIAPQQPLAIGLPGDQVAMLRVSWAADGLSGSFRLVVPFGPYRPDAKIAPRGEMMYDFLSRAAKESGCLILAPVGLRDNPVQFSEEMPVFAALKRSCEKNIGIFDLETGTKLVVLATK